MGLLDPFFPNLLTPLEGVFQVCCRSWIITSYRSPYSMGCLLCLRVWHQWEYLVGTSVAALEYAQCVVEKGH